MRRFRLSPLTQSALVFIVVRLGSEYLKENVSFMPVLGFLTYFLNFSLPLPYLPLKSKFPDLCRPQLRSPDPGAPLTASNAANKVKDRKDDTGGRPSTPLTAAVVACTCHSLYPHVPPVAQDAPIHCEQGAIRQIAVAKIMKCVIVLSAPSLEPTRSDSALAHRVLITIPLSIPAPTRVLSATRGADKAAKKYGVLRLTDTKSPLHLWSPIDSCTYEYIV
ncbi:hypothetical protein BDZ89DRAFT_1131922 [Hymenopellis radicata]|nr:hypothetical protein BDZ89DRAFT_1131922 [Hymenopellis radicata]